MGRLLKKAGITGIAGLLAFMPAITGNTNIKAAKTRQAKKAYKYKQDKKQVKEFSSIKADASTLDIVIKKSGSKDFYISYNLNCNNSSNPVSYKIEDGVLSIKEQGLKWPVIPFYADKDGRKIYDRYYNKIYVYIPSGANIKNYNLDTGAGDLFIKNIAINNSKITTESGDIDLNVPEISGSMDIKTESGDIDINTDRDTKITTDINGQLNINTESGDVDIRKSAINKIFKIRTESGDLDISKSAINKIFKIRTGSGDLKIFNSAIKGKLDVKTESGDADIWNLDISGNTDIQTSNGDVDIKMNSKYIDKIGINFVTKNGDMYIKKLYKGTKRKNGAGYEYTRNKNNKILFNVLVTGCGDIELR
ncbi:MAG: DUF4097 family beta strand repeat-containing protein [Lachnospiraceae bacterium]|nr:DUF4097 family beta strand repeat-containing protein [Lachnospiraceae bacterium]